MSSFQQQVAYYILPTLSVIGFGGTVGLARQNGFFKSLAKTLKKPQPTLPNSQSLLIRKWTYIKPVDDLLSFIITFFWPVVDRQNEALTLQALHFMGQLTSVWLVMELEGARTSGWASYLVPAGMAIQNIGAATSIPIWTALHLLTASPVGKVEALASGRKIAAIPYAVALALILPMIGMTSARKPSRKQFWIIMFQIFPIVSWAAGKLLAGRVNASSEANAVQTVYYMAIAISTLSHLSTFGPSLASQLAPGLFSEGKAKRIAPQRLFLPRLSLRNKNDMVEATHSFLQWDETVTMTAFLVWAVVRTIPAAEGLSVATSKSMLKVLAQSFVFGPAGAAILALRHNE